MSVQQYKQVGYGLTQALPPLAAFPIISQRAPLTTDKAQLGTIWVNVPAGSAYVLASIINNVASWIGIGGGGGTFTNLVVSGTSTLTGAVTAAANITSTGGNIVASAGNIIAAVGNVTAAGPVVGLELIATGDSGAGVAAETAFTNVINNTQGGGALTIMATTAFPGTNTGFIKIYVGTTVAYLPYFTNISPT